MSVIKTVFRDVWRLTMLDSETRMEVYRIESAIQFHTRELVSAYQARRDDLMVHHLNVKQRLCARKSELTKY